MKKLLISAGLLVGSVMATHIHADWTTSNPFKGVEYTALRDDAVHSILGWQYSHLDVDIMEIDLGASGISFATTPSNGSASLDTTRKTTMSFMNSTNTEIAINTMFYGTSGSYANVIGKAVCEGINVSDHAAGWPIINLSSNNLVEVLTDPNANSFAYWHAFAGSDIIVQNGQTTGNGQLSHATERHPRTAIGYNSNTNKLILMTVDGRRTDSIGVKNNELGTLMKHFGATWAVNLDGGGSTQMTMNNGTAHYVNTPSESYRAVGHNFGVHAIVDNTYRALVNFEHQNKSTFKYSPGYSGSSTGFNESASSATLVDTDTPLGESAMKLNIVDDSSQSSEWLVRMVSGSSATRSQNIIRTASGYIGVWAKTSKSGIYISIAIDDPTTGDRGVRKAMIADGSWHLYEWNVDNASEWETWVNNTNGQVDGVDFTLDSVHFMGKGNAVIYFDNIAHDSDESLSWVTQ